MTLRPSISSMFVSKADDNDISPKIVIEIPKGMNTAEIYIHAIVIMKNGHSYKLQLFNRKDPDTCIYEINLNHQDKLPITNYFSTIDIAAVSDVTEIPSDKSFEYIYSLVEDEIVIDTKNTFIYFKEMDD